MHFLITGGAGFIGSHLTDLLLQSGHVVTALDDFSTCPPDSLAETKARVIKGSVLDRSLVFDLVASCDYVFHLASVVGVRLAMARGIRTLKTNFLGTENVLAAATEYNKEVFIASSSAVLGKIVNLPAAESSSTLLGPAYKASWLYSAAKLVEEHLAFAYYREKKTKVKVGRFFNVIGPRQTGAYGMVVPTFITAALKGEPLLVYGDGSQTRTFVYIGDALKGVEIVVKRGKPGRIYNIGGTEEISILSLAQKIIAMTKSSSPIKIIPYEKL
ncbi:MAG TPA: NAD-dependent epimerase/dehydratase family protein [Firmicutes bacterium]|nr:NAD-dependent epimerase/dehydratase family protein [Bacillota bacterium]